MSVPVIPSVSVVITARDAAATIGAVGVAELAEGHGEIASAVIALARNLNLCTVAEGVETPEQADELGRLGATYLQGFSLAEPMTGGRAAAWFAVHGETAP